MPKPKKITREQILEAAEQIVRSSGIDALRARMLADKLNCSTQPLFREYKTMDEIKADVIVRVGEKFNEYYNEKMKQGGVHPYRASGLAYIGFSKDEKEFFKLLFMRDRTNERLPQYDTTVNAVLETIKEHFALNQEEAHKLHERMWVVVHGIATLNLTGFVEMSDETVNEILSDIFTGLMLLDGKTPDPPQK